MERPKKLGAELENCSFKNSLIDIWLDASIMKRSLCDNNDDLDLYQTVEVPDSIYTLLK